MAGEPSRGEPALRLPGSSVTRSLPPQTGAATLVFSCVLVTILVLSTAPSLAQSDPEAIGIVPRTSRDLAYENAREIATKWLGARSEPEFDSHVADDPLWQRDGPMLVEQQLAERVVRSWWPLKITEAKAGALLDGFSYYMATRAIESAFDRVFRQTGYGFEFKRYFGGHLMWTFRPLRLSRHAAARRDRYAATFDSLERWLGTPALQTAMFEVARLSPDRLSAESIVSTMSNAVGQDLRWIFDAAESDISYAITDVSANSVTVTRRGSGMFTGRTAARVGEFDSGDAIRLRVLFDDDSSAWASWDGRDDARTFRFQGPSPVKAAYLDPDNVVTLDANRLDNVIVPPQPTNVPVRKWTARWMVWLQHTLLSYGLLA